MAEAKKKEKAKVVKETKKEEKVTKNVRKDVKKKDKKEKKSLWTRFRIFCHGVKSETLSVHWPNKKDMIKYSIATIVFIVFCSLFFYAVEIIFALIQALFN